METKQKRTKVKVSVLALAALGLLALCAPAWAVLGPVSYWNFDEASENIAYDSVNGNHGTIYGATWTTGIVNGALSFDGVDDYVVCGNDASLQITGALAIEAWIKTDTLTLPQWQQITGKGTSASATGNGFWMWIRPDGSIFVQDNGASYNEYDCAYTGSGVISTGLWYHIVGIYPDDGSNRNKIYINGEEQNVTRSGLAITGRVVSAGNFEIGGRKYGSEMINLFNGTIDEVAIYNGALTGSEIWDSYVSVKAVHLLQGLADQVIALNIQKGISNSLDAKLNAALQALDDLNENNNVAAINTLQAFINAVEAQRGKQISQEDADALIATAQKIIDLLTAE